LLKTRPVNRHHAGAAVNDMVEDRRKLVGDLDRYGALLRLITDPQAIAALEQLIRETRYPVACNSVVAANAIIAAIETVRPPSCTSAGEIN
jgi:hypothetical protein